MSIILRSLLTILLFGLLGLQQVQGIDGDLGNPYTSDTSQDGNTTVIFDGNLDYGGKYDELPVLTLVGSGVLALGFVIIGIVLINSKKNKRSV
jgi:hypothetical protein